MNARVPASEFPGDRGASMALPSGAIVIIPCGGNEPLVKPAAPAPPMPH